MEYSYCPTCRKKLPSSTGPDAPCFPFCSQRCQLIDLGHWFSEDYAIPPEADASATGNNKDQIS